MTKETIIYGGAFNPPTLAHQAIVQKCVEYAKLHNAEIWLLPSGERHDKTIGVPYRYRLALLRALLQDVDQSGVTIRVETSELCRTESTETWVTVDELTRSYPERHFVWVFGTDSLAAMPSWRHGRELIRSLPMLIAERKGSIVDLPGKNCRYLGVKTGGISSTEVRRRLAADEDYSGMVSESVGELLRQR